VIPSNSQEQCLKPSSHHLLIQNAFAPIQSKMEQLSTALYEYLPPMSPPARQILGHIFSSGGKRVRPATFFLASRLFKTKSKYSMPMAIATEYVHTASLLHDDVIDNSSLRRNKPTANHIWGDESAVLVGDLIYARASEMMAQTGHLEIVKTFAKAIRKMSEGELLQLEHVFDFKQKKSTYLEIIEAKTGALIRASFKTAAVLAEAKESVCKNLETIGHYLGMAFQIIDDALDYVGSTPSFGKKNYQDLREGKVTLPLILLRDKCLLSQKKQLEHLFCKGKWDNESINWLQKLLKKHECIETSLLLAKDYTQKAIQILDDTFEDSKEKTELKKLSFAILDRPY